MRIIKFLGVTFCENLHPFTRHFSFLDYQECIQVSILELSWGPCYNGGKIGSYYEVDHKITYPTVSR